MPPPPVDKTNKTIRTCEISGVFYFSIVDIVSLIVETNRPRQWWHDYKTQNLGEIIRTTGKPTWKKRLVHEFVRVKIKSSDGRSRPTDMAPAKTILKILSLIGSKSVPMTYRVRAAEKENARHKKICTSQVAACRNFILKNTRGPIKFKAGDNY
jgi:recombinational DNA repair protein RecT